MLIRLVIATCLATIGLATPSAQSDLDALMARVLARRDDNWKKLQQYTLRERDTLQLTALVVFRLFGFDREYLWFPRGGFFIRSPLTAEGVEIDEERRRRAEERWLRMSQNREKRAADCRASSGDAGETPAADDDLDDVIQQSFEPEFIQSANFLRFTFEQGRYALAGREQMLGRDVLRVEYYPRQLFRDDDNEDRCGRRRPRRDRQKATDDRGQEIQEDMNKTSLVTLWVDPAASQILRYEFRNVGMDFLPARWLLQMDSLRATMQMAEPFPNVWLPDSVSMRFRMTVALGPMEGRYEVKYSDYKLAETSGRVVP